MSKLEYNRISWEQHEIKSDDYQAHIKGSEKYKYWRCT